MVGRLSHCVGAPGGMDADAALHGAQTALRGMALEADQYLSHCLAQMLQVLGGGAVDALTAQRLNVLAMDIHTSAGSFDRPHLSSAAKIVADGVEELFLAKRLTLGVLRMFLGSLQSLFREERLGGDEPAALVSGLQILCSRSLAGKQLERI